MRVISGKFKGKRLFSPEGNRVRPTTDRIKETIFNILSSKNAIVDTKALDLFCGSGALGIEALSRGCASVVFVDIDRDSLALAKKNLAHVKAAPESYEIYHAEYKVALKKSEGRRFGLIFLDPPYGKNIEHDCFNLIDQYNILSDGGIIVFEHSAKVELQNPRGRYIIDTRNMGGTSVSFLTLNALPV